MIQKILMGVQHKDKEELELVINKMQEYNPDCVGLELPENYTQREMFGVRIFFFNDLARIAKKENREVIPLESPNLYDYYKSILVAINVVQGKLERKKLEERIVYYKLKSKDANCKPPEIIYQPLLKLTIYQKALDILNQEPSLNEVLKLWDNGNQQREEYVKKNIDRTKPDLVIIGDGHAKSLTTVLPDYEYVTSF